MTRIFVILIAIYGALYGIPSTAMVIKSGEFEINVGTVPNWVIEEEVPKIKQKAQISPVRYRMFDRQLRIADHQEEYFEDFVSMALNQEGVKQLSKVELSYNPAFEKLSIHSLEVERDGKWHDRLSSSRINVINQEQELVNDLFHGIATTIIVIDDVRVGDSVRYQYSIKGRNPVYGDEFAGQFSMGWSTAADKVTLRIVNQSKTELNLVTADELAYKTAYGKFGKEHLWHQSNASEYPYEEGTPNSYIWEPRVFFSSSKDWKTVVDWAKPHYASNESHSSELALYIEQLKSKSISLMDKVSEAIRFVQNDIRYFGVEIGQNSHIPHVPSLVFERRYGDCKDKANLLKSILTELGVVTYPALVNTYVGDALNKRIPSAQSFNHVINYIEFDGKQYWVDATNNSQAIGLELISAPDFGYALVLSPGSEQLSVMPKGELDNDKISVNQEYISPNYGENAELYVTTRYKGKEADYIRYQLAGVSTSEAEQYYLNYYARFYNDIEVASALRVVDDKKTKNEVTILEHYTLGDFWVKEEQRYDFYIYAGQISNFTELPKILNRKNPLSNYQPLRVEHIINVSLPEDIQYSVRERPAEIRSKRLAYTSEEIHQLGMFSRRHTLDIKSKVVDAKHTKVHIKNLKEINQDLGYEGSVNGDFSVPINSGISYLEQVFGADYE